MRVVVLGGGLAGMAAAAELARLGHTVTLFEARAQLGGVARSFQQDGMAYPVAYHHILASDVPLKRYLKRLGLAHRVKWSRPGVAFLVNGRSYDLSRPFDLVRFPMSSFAKLELLRLGVLAQLRPTQADLIGLDARSWLRGYVSSGEVVDLFQQIINLRFGVSMSDMSAAYLHQRLAIGEGSRSLGYIPGAFWTELLIKELSDHLHELGVSVELSRSVVSLSQDGGYIKAVTLADGEEIGTDAAVAAVMPEVIRRLLPDYDADWLRAVQTVGVISCVMETSAISAPRHYWTTCLNAPHTFAAVFRWEALNPELGAGRRSLLNFSCYAPSSQLLDRPWNEQIIAQSFVDGFKECFGISLKPIWTHTTVIPRYTPIYIRGFRTAPVRSRTIPNLFFAGNHRTFPAVATTGTALQSGEDAARSCHQTIGIAS